MSNAIQRPKHFSTLGRFAFIMYSSDVYGNVAAFSDDNLDDAPASKKRKKSKKKLSWEERSAMSKANVNRCQAIPVIRSATKESHEFTNSSPGQAQHLSGSSVNHGDSLGWPAADDEKGWAALDRRQEQSRARKSTLSATQCDDWEDWDCEESQERPSSSKAEAVKSPATDCSTFLPQAKVEAVSSSPLSMTM